MPEEPSGAESARRLYDRIASWYARIEAFESKAKERALETIQVPSGGSLLEAGAGAGEETRRLLEKLAPGARLVGIDLSFAMARRARRACAGWLIQANAMRLPFRDHAFDQVYCSYLLDLFPHYLIEPTLAEFDRLLKPGGCLTLLSLSEGVDAVSRGLVALWRGLYRLSPRLCAGCRPLALAGSVRRVGFDLLSCETIVQLGVPSQLILAQKPGAAPEAPQSAISR